MNSQQFSAMRQHVSTPHGEIAYVEKGEGPPALFVHGVLLNGYLWRDAIDALSDVRRCIAIDLLGHGATTTKPDADMSFTAQAAMIASFVEALGLDQVDLVANDSGGGISQIFAANHPERIRTLTLTNCDTHDNYPPTALEPLLQVVKSGGLAAIGKRMLEDVDFARQSFATAYERPHDVAPETFATYLGPLLASDESVALLERFLLGAADNSQNVRIEPKLKQLQAPALIIWATDDVFFDVKWAHWLKETLPGAREVIEVPGAKLFFPEERPAWFADQLRRFWTAEAARSAA
jgi:pimeloyl-ACP methyl ester carboxylesterase